MKKIGFTLAEVLVTLAVVGVVAALTLPTLQADITQRQIGPKLAKAVSTFEQASEALLNERMSDSLIDADIVVPSGNGDNYASNLTNFMKATAEDSIVKGKDGFWYYISGTTATTSSMANLGKESVNFYATIKSSLHPHNNNIGSVKIDINGGNPPDSDGEDLFYFTLYDDGSLRPVGGRNWNGNGATNMYNGKCDSSNSSNLKYCAGYIFENGLKADYKID